MLRRIMRGLLMVWWACIPAILYVCLHHNFWGLGLYPYSAHIGGTLMMFVVSGPEEKSGLYIFLAAQWILAGGLILGAMRWRWCRTVAIVFTLLNSVYLLLLRRNVLFCTLDLAFIAMLCIAGPRSSGETVIGPDKIPEYTR